MGKEQMHKEQVQYCNWVKHKFPQLFRHRSVLDVGSLDINGNNRGLFTCCNYTGVDIVAGKNVDIVCYIHEYKNKTKYNVVISTEMLEHDIHWEKSIIKMYDLLLPDGLLLITCATTGRKEHGTINHQPKASPGTTNYYHNISLNEFLSVVGFLDFKKSEAIINPKSNDLYFYGVK